MYLRTLIILMVLFTTVGCGHNQYVSKLYAHPHAKFIHKISHIPNVSDLHITGSINVRIHPGYHHSKLVLNGYSSVLPNVRIYIKHQTLFIESIDENSHAPDVSVDIYIPKLNKLSFHGRGDLVAHHLNTQYLYLDIDTPNRVDLEGRMNIGYLRAQNKGYIELRGVYSRNMHIYLAGRATAKIVGIIHLAHIDARDSARLELYWVKSHWLYVRERDAAFVELAGITKTLDVHLHDRSVFYGRYLRADNAFVKAQEKSKAEVTTLDNQHTLAENASDVYYYHTPITETNFMTYNGAVLRMFDDNIHREDVP